MCTATCDEGAVPGTGVVQQAVATPPNIYQDSYYGGYYPCVRSSTSSLTGSEPPPVVQDPIGEDGSNGGSGGSTGGGGCGDPNPGADYCALCWACRAACAIMGGQCSLVCIAPCLLC
jgi:hypothetical protein